MIDLSRAASFGGWSLYLKGGRPSFAYNYSGLELYSTAAPRPLPPGRHTILYDFTWGGGAPGTGGVGKLSVNGQPAGEVTIVKTMPDMYPVDEGVDIGTDNETVVTRDYPAGNNRFTRRINKVTVALK